VEFRAASRASDAVPQRIPSYTAPMADESELETLARRYLDLWEGQLSAMAADSELAEQLGRLFAATNASLLASVKAAEESGAGAGHAERETANETGTSAGGPEAAAAAHGHRALDMAELDRRLAALERRLDALERRQSRASD
jgi:hypothetical protein